MPQSRYAEKPRKIKCLQHTYLRNKAIKEESVALVCVMLAETKKFEKEVQRETSKENSQSGNEMEGNAQEGEVEKK